jgi:transcriptional antiterminator RfaH
MTTQALDEHFAALMQELNRRRRRDGQMQPAGNAGLARWYVLLVEPSSERKAVSSLLAHHVDAYLPEFPQRRRCGRRSRSVLVPMMPGYLFARLVPGAEPWQRIRTTDGIRASNPTLKVDGRHALVPDAAMRIIMAKEAALCERPCDRPDALRVGQTIQITEGPFAWVTARIEDLSKLDTHGRIKAAFELLGRVVRVDLEVGDFAAA